MAEGRISNAKYKGYFAMFFQYVQKEGGRVYNELHQAELWENVEWLLHEEHPEGIGAACQLYSDKTLFIFKGTSRSSFDLTNHIDSDQNERESCRSDIPNPLLVSGCGVSGVIGKVVKDMVFSRQSKPYLQIEDVKM